AATTRAAASTRARSLPTTARRTARAARARTTRSSAGASPRDPTARSCHTMLLGVALRSWVRRARLPAQAAAAAELLPRAARGERPARLQRDTRLLRAVQAARRGMHAALRSARELS